MTVQGAPAASVGLLRPALEAAIHVARAGEAADPPEPAPTALRPYLRFARLPTPALEVARRVVDTDDAFRRRVSEATSERDVGRAAWLWLTRPDGWMQEIDSLRRQAQERESLIREERAEYDARRRLSRAEDAARRAELTKAAQTRELSELRAEIAEARAARTQAEGELNEVRDRLAALREERNQAMRLRKEAEAELANRTADLRHARHQLRMTEEELEAALASGEVAAAPVTVPEPSSSEEEATAPDRAFDRDALGAAVAAASEAAASLSTALANASALLAAPPAYAVVAPVAAAVEPVAPAPTGDVPRTPARLPMGMLDDSQDAAEHLVRLPRALLLVDGYNVSKTAWPALTPVEQRDRLVDALAELQARTGVDIEVVFDGAEEVATAPRRSPVRRRFSSAGVEADDVILALVDTIPVARPVVVASTDRAVRDGARARGANVMSSRQLLGVLRR